MAMIVRHQALASGSVKMPRTARLLPISLGALLIGTAACGGSSDDESASSSPAASIESTTVVAREVDDPDAPGEVGAVGDTETVCAELQIVQDLSAEVSQSVNDILSEVAAGTSGNEAETLQAFVELGDELEADLPELLAAYERAAAAASTEVAEEIRAVAGGTALLTPALAAGFRDAAQDGEFVDIEEVLGEPVLQDAAQRSGLASLRLDNFTNAACGFQFSNG
jgi:hypothetical protein